MVADNPSVDRFVASSLFCVRLYLKSYIAVLIYFDGAEIKDTTTTTTFNVRPGLNIGTQLDPL